MAVKNSARPPAAGLENIGDNPRILAFDLGQKCGVAKFEGEELKGIALWNFDTARRASLGTKYLAFKTKLETEVAEAKELGLPLHFVYEAVDFAGRSKSGSSAAYAQHAWGAMEAVLHMVADSNNIPVVGLNVRTIKAKAAGNGNATKEDMQTQCRVSWPQFRWSEDEADAAMTGWAYLHGATATNPKHQ